MKNRLLIPAVIAAAVLLGRPLSSHALNPAGAGPTSSSPVVSQTPLAAPAGATFSQWGTGFTPNGTATLHFRKWDLTELPTASQSIDANGGFVRAYPTEPDEPVGFSTWWAVDDATLARSNDVTYEITSACALGTVASLRGTVVDAATGSGIPSATVAFFVGGLPVAQAGTDATGRYAMTSVPCGTSGELTVTAPGCAHTGAPVVTRNDSSPVVQSFRLRPITGIPVLLIPGIMGSGLGDGVADAEVGFPLLPAITPAPASWLGLVKTNRWDGLRALLSANGYVPWEVPWDWRVPLDQAYRIYLKRKIEAIRNTGYLGGIPAIAHGMGGLLVRAYIQEEPEALQNIGPFAMVGTPNLGSTVPYFIWEGGSPTLADEAGGAGGSPGFSAASAALWQVEGYQLLFGSPEAVPHRTIRRFVRSESPPLRQLMSTEPFLMDVGSDALEAVTGDSVNNWLNDLNASVSGMSPDGAGGTVRTGLFIGGAKQTLETITVRAVGVPGLWEDGYPMGTSTGAGDGVVPYASALYPVTAGWAELVASDTSASHATLVDAYAASLCAFVKGSECAGDPAPASPGSLVVRVEGPQHFQVTDPLGRRAGIDPVTLAPLREIPGSDLGYSHASGLLTVTTPATGTWQVALSGGTGSDFSFNASFFGGEGRQQSSQDILGYSPGVPVSFEVKLLAGIPPTVSIRETLLAPKALAVRPRTWLSGVGSELSWTPIPETGVAAYHIYGASPEHPHFAKLASVDAGTTSFFTSAQAWCGEPGCTPFTFAVTAEYTEGGESLFSNLAINNDRDHDRLPDAEEAGFGTDPTLPDSDGDGYGDADELDAGSSPTEAEAIPSYPPNAEDDRALTGEGRPVTIAVLANDSDPNLDPLQVSAVGAPGHGTASTDGTTVAYVPEAGFSGTDTFVYTLGDGTGGTDTAAVTVTVARSFRATSAAAYDGWVLESEEASGRGGSLDTRGTLLRIGDDARKRQYRAILSFDTRALPDNAVILAAQLRLRHGGATGTNPFATHGNLLLDAMRGGFSGKLALQTTDFQAGASRVGAATVRKTPVAGWYTTAVPATCVSRTGPTQLRLRFAKDDDNDRRADYLSLYSGNAPASSRPALEVLYSLP